MQLGFPQQQVAFSGSGEWPLGAMCHLWRWQSSGMRPGTEDFCRGSGRWEAMTVCSMVCGQWWVEVCGCLRLGFGSMVSVAAVRRPLAAHQCLAAGGRPMAVVGCSLSGVALSGQFKAA